MVSCANGSKIPRLLSAEEVAECLNVSRDLVYRLARCGDIPIIPIGTGAKARVLFDPRDVQAYVESRRCGMSAVIGAEALSLRTFAGIAGLGNNDR
jgi:excisionase family DNA binding protein